MRNNNCNKNQITEPKVQSSHNSQLKFVNNYLQETNQ